MKVGLISLGCPKNLVDSEVMLGLARRAGHEVTADAASAEVLVVNTCAFIDRAKQESVDTILEMAQLKKTGACRRLIVTGCLAERYRHELRTEIPEIDAALGIDDVPRIVDAIDGSDDTRLETLAAEHPRRDAPECGVPLRGAALPVTFFRSEGAAGRASPTGRTLQASLTGLDAQAAPSSGAASTVGPPTPSRRVGGASTPTGTRRGPEYLYDAETPRLLTTPPHYAYLKVAEGCDYACAFCIIPTLRGRYRSRPLESIVEEARALAERGVRELLLVSQDTTFYGVDRHERHGVARLVRALNKIDNGLEWIRLLYLFPTTIDHTVLDAIAESTKACKYIDLPLQHGSDAVLTRMKRPGTRQRYERLLAEIRTRVPGVALRTTFIVGFPGETDAEFDELCDFLETMAFDHVGVFTYSHGDGTSAFAYEDNVPPAVKEDRRARLLLLQLKIVERRHRSRLGTRARLLVDGSAAEHELVLKGRLETQAPDIDPVVYLTECPATTFRPGDFVEVEIVGSRGYDLIARPVGREARRLP